MTQKLEALEECAKRLHRFCFTNFDLTLDYSKWNYSYLLYGKEKCPTTGRDHHQGYVEFKNARTVGSMIKKLKGKGKVFCARGSADQNKTYCKKSDPDFFEDGKVHAQGARNDLADIFEKIADGVGEIDIAESNPTQWCYHRRAFREYRELKEVKRDWVPDVFILWGDSGSGKTRRAYEAGAVKVTYDGKFFGGYDGEDVVLFDDIDIDSFVGKRQELLNLTDRYPHKIRVIGGWRNWKPRVIYFTTNTDPERWFLKDAAVRRRVTDVIKMTI